MDLPVASRRRVAVVGGGVVGCATAYRLARAGLRVTLIERDAIAAHASGHNTGNLNPLHGTPSALVPFALDAFRDHRTIQEELALLACANSTLHSSPRIHVGSGEPDRQHLEEVAALFESYPGFSSAWLDRQALSKLEAGLGPEIEFGVLTTGNLTVDSHDLTRSLAEGAVRLDAVILREGALGIVSAGSRVIGVKTSQRIVPCDDVVLATGPWGVESGLWLGIDVAVTPMKGELLLMKLPNDTTRHDLTWGQTSLYRRRKNEIWIGGTMESCGLACSPTVEAQASLLKRAEQILASIRHAELLNHVAALRPMPASDAPIAARADGWQNAYIANGGGSKGVLWSVSIAAKIRDLVLEVCGEAQQNV